MMTGARTTPAHTPVHTKHLLQNFLLSTALLWAEGANARKVEKRTSSDPNLRASAPAVGDPTLPLLK